MGVAPSPTVGSFDVFLSHSSIDKPSVEAIAERLLDLGVRAFLDKWHLSPGMPWQDELSAALAASGSIAVFIGPSSSGPWRHEETRLALDRAVSSRDEFRVIPVLLPNADLGAIDGFLAQRTWVDFRAGLDDSAALDRLIAGIRGEAFTDDRFELPSDPAPYRGLLRFESVDAPLFFGRDDEISLLVERLSADSLVAVVGPSGSGKSSLVRAGLLPHLGQVRVPTAGDWVSLTCSPGPDPFRSLAEQVARLEPTGPTLTLVDELTDRLRTRDDGLITAVRGLTAEQETAVVIVIDQFEELFTLGQPERRLENASRFAASLVAAADDPTGRLKTVVTLRADFVGAALSVEGFSELLQDRQVLLGALGGDRLRAAIVRPAEAVGALFEKGLVSTIMTDVGQEPGALPMLQHALHELWRRRRGPWLTIDAYHSSGGVVGALSAHADAVYERLPPRQQLVARTIFIRLCALGDGVPDTRRRASIGELYPSGSEPGDIDAALLALSGTDARLVVLDDDTAQIAHEALLRSWRRLRGWLEEDREALRTHRQLSQAATEWEHNLGRDSAALLSGGRLAEAVEFSREHRAEMTDLELRFVEASAQHEADSLEAERERTRQLRRRFLAAMAALVLAILGAGAALIARSEAESALDEVERRRLDAVASQALALADTDPALATAIAAEAAGRQESVTSRSALVGASLRALLRPARPDGLPLNGHTGFVSTATFSPDSALLATGSADMTIRLWDPSTGTQVGNPLTGHTGSVLGVAFNHDGTLLASASADGTIRLWDPISGTRLGNPLTGHTGSVLGVAFNHDGTLLASASADGTIRLWDPISGTRLGNPLTGHTAGVSGVDFGHDGRLLASSSEDGTVRLWDPATGAQIGEPLTGHLDWVTDVSFSRDGTLLATASFDGTAGVWDPITGIEVAGPLFHGFSFALAVAFNDDDTMLATADTDGTVRLWDPATGAQIGEALSGHTDDVNDVAFNHDGTLLVTASDDATVRLWAMREDALLRGHTDWGYDVAFNDDGALLATASGDNTVRLWDPSSGTQIGDPLTGHTEPVTGLAFNHDGTLLASSGIDESVRLWDPATGIQVGDPLTAHTDWVHSLTFSPDGSLLATASSDATVRLWDPATGDPVGVPLNGHATDVRSVAFSPDGTVLATAGDDRTVRVWDAEAGQQIGEPFRGHTDVILSVAFHPDGTLLATTSFDGDVRLWNPTTGIQVGDALVGHDGPVRASEFSPDGSLLATTGNDTTIRLWPILREPEEACASVRFEVSIEQLALALGEEPTVCTDLG